MKHFLEYRRASYDLIMEAQGRVGVVLDDEVEAWTVHTFARYMENPHIPSDTIATRLLSALSETPTLRKAALETVVEECVLIDGLQLNKRRWPSQHYYRDMCMLACEHRAWSDRPPQQFWVTLANQLPQLECIFVHLKA